MLLVAESSRVMAANLEVSGCNASCDVRIVKRNCDIDGSSSHSDDLNSASRFNGWKVRVENMCFAKRRLNAVPISAVKKL